MKKLGFLVVIIMSGFLIRTTAQSVDDGLKLRMNTVCILGISGAVSVEPNEVIDDASTDSISARWLHYSSIIDVGKNHKVTARLSTEFPNLKVAITEYVGEGKGKFGIPSSEITLLLVEQEIIQGIGSCWTGTGNGNGHKLTYLWGNVKSNSPPPGVTVVYRMVKE